MNNSLPILVVIGMWCLTTGSHSTQKRRQFYYLFRTNIKFSRWKLKNRNNNLHHWKAVSVSFFNPRLRVQHIQKSGSIILTTPTRLWAAMGRTSCPICILPFLTIVPLYYMVAAKYILYLARPLIYFKIEKMNILAFTILW